MVGTPLGAFVDRRFLAVPAVVTAFLLRHVLQGWCPPVPLLRRNGVRTAAEIDRERYAVKALRGDFSQIGDDLGLLQARRADQAIGAVST